ADPPPREQREELASLPGGTTDHGLWTMDHARTYDHRMRPTALTLAALCLCSRIAGAQSGSLRVIISGAESRLPLAYSAVTAGDGPGRLTDDSGRVELP